MEAARRRDWTAKMGYNILNPLEKEFLIRQWRRNPDVTMDEFCKANNVSKAAFANWLRRYESEGIEGLYRSKRTPRLLPEGVDEDAENLKRELIRTRIELERLKKGYTRIPAEDGGPGGYAPASSRTTRS